MRSDEVLVAAEQRPMFVHTLSSPGVANGSSQKIRRAFSNRQVQPLHIRSVEFARVLGVAPSLLPTPRWADRDLAFDLDYPILSAYFDHLAIETGCRENPLHRSSIALEAVGCDPGDEIVLHAFRNVTEQTDGVSVTSFPHYSGRPQPRPELDGYEDPNRRLFFAAYECLNFIRLEFKGIQSLELLMIEPSAETSGPFQPAVYGVPSDLFCPGDGRRDRKTKGICGKECRR